MYIHGALLIRCVAVRTASSLKFSERFSHTTSKLSFDLEGAYFSLHNPIVMWCCDIRRSENYALVFSLKEART